MEPWERKITRQARCHCAARLGLRLETQLCGGAWPGNSSASLAAADGTEAGCGSESRGRGKRRSNSGFVSDGSAPRMREDASGIFLRAARERILGLGRAPAFRPPCVAAESVWREDDLDFSFLGAVDRLAAPTEGGLAVPAFATGRDATNLRAFFLSLFKYFSAVATAALAAFAAFLARFANLRAALTLAFACRARVLVRPARAVAAFSSNSAWCVASLLFDARDGAGCFFMVLEIGPV
jgi:hypothetical protein